MTQNSKETLEPKDLKKDVPRWVVATCATLMFLSVFINSIGLNLMQINGALTNRLIERIEGPEVLRDRQDLRNVLEELKDIHEELEDLKALSHPPAKRKG